MLEVGMSTVQEIEQALTELTPEELARFRQWFEEYDAKLWEYQFESDLKSGRLDRLAGQAISDFRAGKSKEL